MSGLQKPLADQAKNIWMANGDFLFPLNGAVG